MIHVKAIETHAVQRLELRYGLELDDSLKHRLIREIKRAHRRRETTETAMLISRSRLTGREIWAVVAQERRIKLVYDPRTRTIVTFLPPGA